MMSEEETKQYSNTKILSPDVYATKCKEELDKLLTLVKEEGKELSKSQMKKLAKKAKWEVMKKEKRVIEKEKKKKKREDKKKLETCIPRKRFKLMKDSTCKTRVAIDLSFGDLMNDQEISKTLKQIQRCYSENRYADAPLQLYLTSMSGKVKAGLESKSGCMNWDVHYVENDYSKTFSSDEIVYLTSESPNILETLEDSKVYVVGGLTDHNQQKGLTFRLAEEKQFSHARLPIDKWMDMKTRKVLSIFHVFEILLCVSQGLSWKDTFLKCIPKRKCAKAKDIASESEDDDDNSDAVPCDKTSDTKLGEGDIEVKVVSK